MLQNQKGRKKIAILATGIIAIIAVAVIVICTRPEPDSVQYEGGNHPILEFPADIFYYDLKEGGDFEEDKIYPIENSPWELVYQNGDVYCKDTDSREAGAYYNDDENYEWFVNIELEDEEKTYPVSISAEELEYIYDMEDMEKETAIFFDEIETMGSLIKVSKDGVIQGITSLAEYDDQWYWRSEIIDDNRERDGEWPEYVIKLPKELNQSITKAKAVGEKGIEPLIASEYWYFYDEVTGEYEKMKFSDDLSFYWGCECGEPVGNSDVFERYQYDKKSQTIKLYNDYDDSAMKIKILDYSDYHILMEINGEIKDYTYLNSEFDVENSEKFFKDYNMYGRIVDGNHRKAVVGPFNHDGDVKYPENAMKTYPLADDIEFYDLQITKHVKDDQESTDVIYDELSREEGVERLPYEYGFIWFNDNMEIEKITYYGQIDIYE